MPDPVPPPPPPAAPQRPPAGTRPSLTGSFSLKVAPVPTTTEPRRLTGDVKPLSQEDLEAYWQEAATRLGLGGLLASGHPRLGEKPSLIEIDALTVAFNEDFRPYKVDVMQVLREKSGMPMLECKVNPMFITKEELIYSPDNKFKAMLEANPAMLELRKLFPQIDH